MTPVAAQQNTFVFFHVGANLNMPEMLTKSIRITNGKARIIQCTDYETPVVENVDIVHRVVLDTSRLMQGRLKAFSTLGLREEAIYLDTDMLVVKPINVFALLQNQRASLCSRSFGLTGVFNTQQRGLDFSEFYGRPLGNVYPFVACSTVTDSCAIWTEWEKILEGLDPKFSIWYGDQEAMKIWARDNQTNMSTHDESIFGCLPEERAHLVNASILHFKGLQRKRLMELFFNNMILSTTV